MRSKTTVKEGRAMPKMRDIAEKREVGDVTTLADSSVMDLISTEAKGSTD